MPNPFYVSFPSPSQKQKTLVDLLTSVLGSILGQGGSSQGTPTQGYGPTAADYNDAEYLGGQPLSLSNYMNALPPQGQTTQPGFLSSLLSMASRVGYR